MASTKVTEKNLILVVSGDAKKAEKEMAKVRDAINNSFKNPQSTLEKFGSMARESWDKYESGAVRALRATNIMVEAFASGKDKGEALVTALKMMPGAFGALALAADSAADAIVGFLTADIDAEERRLLADIKVTDPKHAEKLAALKEKRLVREQTRLAKLQADGDEDAFKDRVEAEKARDQKILAARQKREDEWAARSKAARAAEIQSLGNHIQRVADMMEAERLGVLAADQRIQDARAVLAEAASARAQSEIQTSIERGEADMKAFLDKFEAEVERLETLRTQDPWEAMGRGSKRFGAELQVLQSSFEGLGQVAGQAFQAILTGNESVSAAGLLDAFLESIGMEFQMLAIKEAGLALASAFVPGMQAAAAGHAAAAAIFQGGAIAAGLGARAIESGGGGVPGGGSGGGANDAGRASSGGSGGNTTVENHYNLGWGFFDDQKQFMREMDRMRREAESDGTVPPAGKRGPGGRRR